MKRDLLITYTVEGLTLVCGIVIFKIIKQLFGDTCFSEYALSRRAISFLQPSILMGLSVGIPRFMAISIVKNEREKANAYFTGSLIVLFCSSIVICSILYLFSNTTSQLIYGSSKYSYLIGPLCLCLHGIVSFSALYSYLRGKMAFLQANILKAVFLGVIPILACYISKPSIKSLLGTTGIFTLLASIPIIIYLLVKNKVSFVTTLSSMREVFKYGIQRVPGDFCIGGILSLPAIITAHLVGVTQGGYVAFAVSILNMLGVAFGPIGLVLLPKTSQLIANNDFKTLRQYILRVLKVSLFATVIPVVFYEIFAEHILVFYLGNPTAELIAITRVLMLAGIIYPVYISLRSIIDSFYDKGVNTINIIYSLAFFATIESFLVFVCRKGSSLSVVTAFVLTLLLLGLLTLWEIYKILKTKLKNAQ